MDPLTTPEVWGIGAVAIAAITIFWRLTSKVLDVVEKNTEAMEAFRSTLDISSKNQERMFNSFQKSIESNTEVTRQTAETMRQTRDIFSSTLAGMLNQK